MIEAFQNIVDWAEVWGLFIPGFVLLIRPKQPYYLFPVIIYIIIAFFLYLFIDLIWQQKRFGIDLGLYNNNPLYNVNSICRLICFSLFFIRLRQPFLTGLKLVLPFLFILFAAINFIFLENFFRPLISSTLLMVESAILIFYCLQYYLYLLKSEQSGFSRLSDFWVVTGLSIMVITSFSIYYLYDRMVNEQLTLAINIWEVHKAAYIVFCIFLAKAFYTNER
jgi:hypothetical protein